ncbi:MAG: toxin-antitoxin system YwqK family antitoxin [Bacteroidota bacterium]
MRFSPVMIFLTLLFNTPHTPLSAQHKKKMPFYELDVIRGLFFQPNTIDPYTGTGVEEFADGRKKMQVPIKDGKINGTVREWSVNGQKVFEAEYEMGVQVGVEKQWFASGQQSLEIPYTAGQPDGMCVEWFKHGRKKSEGLFRDGKEQGEHTWWHFNGRVDQKLTYRDGKAEGLVINWYDNGQLKMEANYQAGLKHGLLKRWYANGQLHSEGTYAMGEADGEEKTWSKAGLLEGKTIYEKGQVVREFNYRSGSIFMGNSYLVVVNEKESFFSVEVKGDRVSPRWTNGVSSYTVDGDLLQIFNYPIQSAIESASADLDEAELLRLFQVSEQEVLREKYGPELTVEHTLRQTPSGEPYLEWSFRVPASYPQREGAQKVVAEHFLSIICHKQVLNLRSIVIQEEDPSRIRQLLERTAATLQIKKDRIDLNTVLTNDE